MSHSRVILIVCLLGVAGGAGGAAQVESYSVPRTEHGHPDLQAVWATEFLTQLERPEGVDDLVVTPAEAEAVATATLSGMPKVIDPDFEIHGISELMKVGGEYRTSIIVDPGDGRLPYSTAGLELAGRLMTRFLERFDDPEIRPLPERCLENLGLAPIRALPLFLPRRIHQTRDHVLILSEDAVGLRTIHLHGDPPPDEIRSIEGYSVGRWEGDTLVVTTTHLRALWPGRFGLGRALVLSPNSKVVERFTRVSETELFYRYTVEDDELYTQPWSGELSMARHDGRLYEYACHEGNYSMPNVLRGGQAEEDRRAAAQPPGP